MRRVWLGFVVAACSGSSEAPGDSGTDAVVDAPGCVRTPGPADGVRRVVVAHPFDANGGKANTWEVLDLSTSGELSRPGRMFSMGRASVGEVAFTPDGRIGIAPQNEDGSLGIFKLDDAGVPTVLHANYKGSFYAHRVVIAPSGAIYVLDQQWRNNGGGIYEIAIDCDDVVSDKGKVVESKLPGALAFTEAGWVVAAHDIATSAMGTDVHVLSGAAVAASADAFADDMQIVGGSTLARDGSAFFVGDISQYGTSPRRIAVTPITGAQLGTPYLIQNVEDPITLIASPFADKVLVVSGVGDAMYQLTKTGSMWALSGELTYQGGRPQLPSGAVMIERGALKGLVLVGELSGVRRVEMFANGNLVDRGLFSLGSGIVNSPGAIGVTP